MTRLPLTAASRLAAVLALAGPALASPAEPERVHLSFPDGAPVHAQVQGSMPGRPPHSMAMSHYRMQVYEKGGEPLTLLGYLVKPGQDGCDAPWRRCPDQRATVAGDRAADLPQGFVIDVLAVARERGPLPARAGADPWITASEALPFAPYDGATSRVLDPALARLRPGALAQSDCFEWTSLCVVRVHYAPGVSVNFPSDAREGRLAAQVRAVDVFMRRVIRPGPAPVDDPLPPLRER